MKNNSEIWHGFPLLIWNSIIEVPPATQLVRGVYFLAYQKTLVYIGRSQNIHARLGSHLEEIIEPKQYDEIRIMPCLWGWPQKDKLSRLRNRSVAALEELLIWWLRPKYNKQVRAPAIWRGLHPNRPADEQFQRLSDEIQLNELLQFSRP